MQPFLLLKQAASICSVLERSQQIPKHPGPCTSGFERTRTFPFIKEYLVKEMRDSLQGAYIGEGIRGEKINTWTRK